MTKRAMIDLETLGTKPGCVILEIGIVCNFTDPFKGRFADWRMYLNLDLASQKTRTIDPLTLDWWRSRENAFERVLDVPKHEQLDPITACKQAALVLSRVDEVWANSPSFDCVILREFFEFAGVEVPWKYYQERDFRTAKALHPDVIYPSVTNAHNALDDAAAQAVHLDKLGLWRPSNDEKAGAE